MRICSNCGAPLEPDALFCTECGTKVEIQEGRKCPSCGAPLDDDSAFCAECGCKVGEVPQEKPIAETIVEEPVVERPNETQVAMADVAAINSADDIMSAPKKNNRSWLYAAGGGVAVVLAIIAWLVWSHFSNKLEFTEVQKLVRVTQTVVSLRTQPDSGSPIVMLNDGETQLLLNEGTICVVTEDAGEWYKIVPTGDEYHEAYINKSVCEDTDFGDIPVNSSLFNLSLFPEEIGCDYVVHRLDGRELVISHDVPSNGNGEYLYLGTYTHGYYLFNYRKEISDTELSDYRRRIETRKGTIRLIDVGEVSEKQVLELFKDEIKNKKRCNLLMTKQTLDWFYMPLSLQQAEKLPSSVNGHYDFEGSIAGKYKYNMILNVAGGNVYGQYVVYDNHDGFVDLLGTIDADGQFEMSEYKKDTNAPTGYYFKGKLTPNGISGKYLSRERKINMSFRGEWRDYNK